jgi:D-arginine dehydrogenase
MPTPHETEVLIVGAGIAGAAAAYFLAPHCKVTLLEREDQPGYHTTGRSAALFTETYGNATVRALTRASRAFLQSPPPGFAAAPLLAPRGHLVFARADQMDLLEKSAAELSATGAAIERLSGAQVRELAPALRAESSHAGIIERAARDMDVHAIHRGFLRGRTVVRNADFRRADFSAGRWRVETSAGEFHADILVNAAGAWVDEVARACGVAPIGIQPLRRTVIVFESAAFGGTGTSNAGWPMAIDATEDLYFRPEAGNFLASPADETPSPPCDAQPDEMDIAMLIDRLQAATTFDVRRIAAKWAGLRSFVADRTLVAGFDARQPAFFWLAGQGGYGIQTSPAMGMIAAALLRVGELAPELRDNGVEAAMLSPHRL